MATSFTSREIRESIRRGAAEGSHIGGAEKIRAMKEKGIKPLSGSRSKQRTLHNLDEARKNKIITGFQRDRIRRFLKQTEQAKEVQGPKGPSAEELRKQRRIQAIKQQRRRESGAVNNIGAGVAHKEESSVSRVVPLAGSRIESVGPSSAEASKNQPQSYQRGSGPENVIERGSNLQPPQQEEITPSADEANDLPIE